jgi:hypothetical protein
MDRGKRKTETKVLMFSDVFGMECRDGHMWRGSLELTVRPLQLFSMSETQLIHI